jgi:hypothetical protein
MNQTSLILADVSTNKQFMKVIDIQQTQVFEVCVSWQSYMDWLLINPSNDVALYSSTSNTRSPGYVNGFIAVVPFTRLQSPDNSSVYVNVYVYSKNIQYNRYSSTNMPTARVAIPTESGIISQSGHVLETTQEITCLELNDSSASMDHISELHFGEAPYSLRSLLKRYTTVRHTTVASNATVGGKRMVMVINIFPPIVPAIGDTTVLYPSLLGYLRYAYVGIRGSIRYRLHPAIPLTTNVLAQIKIGLEPDGTSVTESAGYDTACVSATHGGTATFVQGTNGGIEVEIPFYTNNLFGFSFHSNMFPGSTGSFINDVALRQFNYQHEAFADTGGSTLAFRLVYDIASGEDFCLIKFNGAPFYTF